MASNIAAGTITAALLATGIVVAGHRRRHHHHRRDHHRGRVTAGGYRLYSGTPASGNLIGSWSGVATSDAYSNAVPEGLGILGGTLTMGGTAQPAQIVGDTILFADTGGYPRCVPGLSGDTDVLVLGHKLGRSSGTTTINSTTSIAIGGMTFNLGIGAYHVHGTLFCLNGSGTLQPQVINFKGTCAASMRVMVRTAQMATVTTECVSVISAMNSDPFGPYARTPGAGENFTMEFDGWVQVTHRRHVHRGRTWNGELSRRVIPGAGRLVLRYLAVHLKETGQWRSFPAPPVTARCSAGPSNCSRPTGTRSRPSPTCTAGPASTAAADLETLGLDPATAQAILTAVADAYAEYAHTTTTGILRALP